MQIRAVPGPLLLAFLALLVLLGTLDAFRFLWVFPLDTAGLGLWIVLVAADVFLALAELPGTENSRLLLWAAGLLYFTARQGVPLVGIALLFASALLWVGQKLEFRFPVVAAGAAAALFLAGHDPQLLNPAMASRLGDLRFSCHLLASFALFRMFSWWVAVRKRGRRPGFLHTMEYFIGPAFWLSPMHGAHLLFDHMDAPAEKRPKEQCLGWIARGFAHALVFSFLVSLAMPLLEARFRAGVSSFRWWEWVGVGPLLFLASYLEKSRVTYVVAGTLSLTGHDVEPDFRAPWLARDLLEYWRRFHYWLWEYYADLIYMPLAVTLSRRTGASPRAVSLLALFLTFTVGTSLIHWVHYPAPFVTALWLGFLFGAFSLVHGLFSARLRSTRVGIPVTWASVFVLYFLAYPAYGLGWGLTELIQFFGR